MVQKNAPIAVFDSGHGGISVLRALRALDIPAEITADPSALLAA